MIIVINVEINKLSR